MASQRLARACLAWPFLRQSEANMYDGLTFTYSTGQKAGMPEDQYLEFKANEQLYFQYNKPIPSWFNIVEEPDGSVVRYRFAYSNPFNYVEKEVITLPTVTPSGVLIDPGSGSIVQPFTFETYTPVAPYVPMPVYPGPSDTYQPTPYTPAPETSYIPPESPQSSYIPPESPQSSWADLIPLGLAGLVGLGLGAKFKRSKRIRNRKAKRK